MQIPRNEAYFSYAAVTRNAAQRRYWIFNEAVLLDHFAWKPGDDPREGDEQRQGEGDKQDIGNDAPNDRVCADSIGVGYHPPKQEDRRCIGRAEIGNLQADTDHHCEPQFIEFQCFRDGGLQSG